MRRSSVRRFFAFLRAINVGGHTVTMDELRRYCGALGLADVETFIASGNLVFTSRAKSGKALEAKIEAALHKALGYEVPTFIRTGEELAAIAEYQPFEALRVKTAGTLTVGFIAEALPAATTRSLVALKTAVDDLQVRGREIYWLHQGRQSDSLISASLFERTLKVPATFRSINTVTRLVAKYGRDSHS